MWYTVQWRVNVGKFGFISCFGLGCREKANCPYVGPRPVGGGVPSMGGLSKGS